VGKRNEIPLIGGADTRLLSAPPLPRLRRQCSRTQFTPHMNTHAIISNVALLVILLCAAICDLWTRKIPNWLTLSLILCGIIRSLLPRSGITVSQSLLGVLAAIVIPLGLFMIRALGAGDVKLMAGIGACLGPQAGFAIFIAAMVVALVIVLVHSTIQGRLTTLLRNSGLLVLMIVNIRQYGTKQLGETGRSCRSIGKPLPYAVPILLATLMILLMPRLMEVAR